MVATWLRTVFSERAGRQAISWSAAGGDEVEDLAFPCGQFGDDLGGVMLLCAGEEVDDSAGDRGAVDGLSGREGEHGADDVVAAGVFEQVAADAGAERGEDGLVVLVHGEHEYADTRMTVVGPVGSRDAVNSGIGQCPTP